MTRITTGPMALAAGLAVSLAFGWPAAEPAQARDAVAARAAGASPTDVSAQERRRIPPRRLRIYPRDNPAEVYPRFDPGPNAVRDCTATYVQEHRPSGTVITPRMNCYWRRG